MGEEEEEEAEYQYSLRWNNLGGHVFLILIMALYIAGGMGVFYWIESIPDVKLRKELTEEFESLVDMMWETARLNSTTETEWTNEFIARMYILQPSNCHLMIWYDLNGSTPVNQWSDLEAVLYFVVGLVTTCAPGDMEPFTKEGRVLFVIYCFVGIPLFLVTVTRSGSYLKDAIKRILFFLFIWYYGLGQDKRKSSRTTPATMIARLNHRISLLTIAHGSRPPPGKTNRLYRKVEPEEPFPHTWREMNIPTWLATLILCSYLFGWAFIFSKVEGWVFVDAAYYVFMLLPTVGLGDFISVELPRWIFIIFVFTGLLFLSFYFTVTFTRFGAMVNSILKSLAPRGN